ncbi:MAG: hypothetical protein QM756_20745 [Polyangiaceae bacterium]
MRLRIGIVMALAGIVSTLAWALPFGGALGWGVSLGLLASGAFAIFEARAGWCAARALGFKTRV